MQINLVRHPSDAAFGKRRLGEDRIALNGDRFLVTEPLQDADCGFAVILAYQQIRVDAGSLLKCPNGPGG